ncbi:hypothetical protein T09_13708 [Trichinella sp. T9]|nr:hypothetical protein T09_13708 [Trichinella sp. T9]
MSSHKARTDANQCSLGVSMAFSGRPSLPLLITNSKKEFDIMTAVKYQWITSSENFSHSRWHSQIAFPTLLFFLVTQVRNCEDESRILNDLHRITSMACLYSSLRAEERQIRSIKPAGICKFLFALGHSLRRRLGLNFKKFRNFQKIA